ncbi:uncharacterized protein Ecym_1143 [Eremothecium cymbalariae DBVPG|uniref:Cytochrome b5 heme-binding domain-containing protein n=1 Tax=Eremothecium cymbalariae (strain CBS 270.75 / DBVPG 7215 / KCTC 17166 / NRRL Y-17582) TaxID=931890 RepID=G8JMP0_ERECY|nr:hypothetical protein Ecym_1143 [Eremothecium cymbalariae DBVPG\
MHRKETIKTYATESSRKLTYVGNGENGTRAKFTLLDIVRILLGILMLYGAFHRICYMRYWASKEVAQHAGKYVQPSGYWKLKNIDIPHMFSREELAEYSYKKKDYGIEEGETPILLSIMGRVYDVSASPFFYGVHGPYKIFTGRDCSTIFGLPMWDMMSLSSTECSRDISQLTEAQIRRVERWEQFYENKYPFIGYYTDI